MAEGEITVCPSSCTSYVSFPPVSTIALSCPSGEVTRYSFAEMPHSVMAGIMAKAKVLFFIAVILIILV